MDAISPRLAALEANQQNAERLLAEVAKTQHDMAKTLAEVSAQAGAIANLTDQTGKQWDRIHAIETQAARTEERLGTISDALSATADLTKAVQRNSVVAKVVTSIAGAVFTGIIGFLFWMLRTITGG